ncbi:MAG: class I SAM-dependent RNA methyltransferase, partial [Albidovulum sp.]
MTELTIARLGHLGDGIAPGPVFVPMALPGEVVEGVLDGERMADPRIVTPSPDRVKAPCRHYRACGGCALMHASDTFVAGWKTEVVRQALAGQGLEAPFRPILTSPPRSRRRATFSGRRTKSGAIVGFHGRRSGTISEIPDCQILDPRLTALLPVLERVTVAGGSRKAELALSATVTDGGIDLAVRNGKPIDPALFAELARIAAEADLARLSWDGEVIAMSHPPAQRFGRADVVPPAGAFFQATAEGEAALVASVIEAVGKADPIADLFAGCGTFALPLAERAAVHAVEGEAAMTAALDAGWRGAQGLHLVTTEARDLFRRPLLPDELNRFGAVVIDPPRAGAEAQSAQIAASRAPVVAAVSCNPVTFARDARILTEAGFCIDWVQVV